MATQLRPAALRCGGATRAAARSCLLRAPGQVCSKPAPRRLLSTVAAEAAPAEQPGRLRSLRKEARLAGAVADSPRERSTDGRIPNHFASYEEYFQTWAPLHLRERKAEVTNSVLTRGAAGTRPCNYSRAAACLPPSACIPSAWPL